ncbi:hypothetical protein K2X83_01030 [Patescibacteria group bacterium]|nr:hypothetical protein [Patescibacteria group bacterium]
MNKNKNAYTFAVILVAFLISPVPLHAAGILGSMYRGTVTDQGDCTNINGKLMALYRSPTSEGIPFIFEVERTRVMPRWVAPADGQTVFILLGEKVTCLKSNGTSREERRARYYSVSGAQRAAQEVRQTGQFVGSGGGAGVRTQVDIQRLYPVNNLPGINSPYIIRTGPSGGAPSYGGSMFLNSNFGGVNQTIIQDNADVSGGVLIRNLER